MEWTEVFSFVFGCQGISVGFGFCIYVRSFRLGDYLTTIINVHVLHNNY